MLEGSNVGGEIILIFAPNFFSKYILDLATLLCRTSPRIATSKPDIFFLFLLIVKASNKACVGCSLLQSPALITEQLTFSDNK